MAITINTLSDDWSNSPKWTAVPNHFFFNITDDAGKALAGQSVSFVSSEPQGASLTIMNPEAVTDESGNVTLLITADYSALPSGTNLVKLNFSAPGAGAESGDESTGSIELYLDPILIRSPRIPAALDGVITDSDVSGGIFAYVNFEGLQLGNIVVLVWDGQFIQRTVSDNNPPGSYVFDLSEYNESLITNGSHTVSAFVVDNALNASFSDTVTFKVDRQQGGGGLPYLLKAHIPLGDVDDVINEKDMYAALQVVIPDTSLAGKFEHSTSDKSVGSVILSVYNQKNAFIQSLVKTIDIANKSGVYNSTTREITYDFGVNNQEVITLLKSAGIGHLHASYSLRIGDPGLEMSYSSSQDASYILDVIPPGE